MNEKLIQRQVIINALAASGDNVFDDTVAKQWCICELNTTDPIVNWHPPIQYGEGLAVITEDAVTEVVQLSLIGEIEETIVASRRYKIEVFNLFDKYEGGQSDAGIYAYTAPAVLSGNADTDRSAVYTALINKINAHTSNNVIAKLVYRIPFTLGSDDSGGSTGFTAFGTGATEIDGGFTGTQETSAVTVAGAAIEVTSGAFSTDDAAGNIWFYDVSAIGSWSAAAKTLIFDDTAGSGLYCKVTTNAAPTAGQAIMVQDDAGYFNPATPGRNGRTTTEITAGFTTSVLEIQRYGVYSKGSGAYLLADVPVFDRSHQELVSGDADLILNTTPDASKTYTKLTIRSTKKTNKDASSDFTQNKEIRIVVWADDSNGTHLTNLKSALATALAK